MKNIIILIIIVFVIFYVGCKQSSKPLVIQENKPINRLSHFDSLSDSMHNNMFKSIDFGLIGERDSAIYYEGKAHAYLEMEGIEANK